MTIHKLSAGDGYTYLTKHVANADAPEGPVKDAAGYYTAKGAPPGRWHGRLTERVGVSLGQTVTESHMRSVFGAARTPDALDTRPDGNDSSPEVMTWSRDTALGSGFVHNKRPQFTIDVEKACSDYQREHGEYPPASVKEDIKFRLAEQSLRAERGTNADAVSDAEVRKWIADQYAAARASVAGYDLVFTPAKSVSVLWALGDEQMRQSVEAAHEQAVSETLTWIEDEITYTRRGKGGKTVLKADGLLIARFDHWDNRAGDPNLHTHCAVANRVYASGKWTAIDGRVFYRAAVAASERYNSRIIDILARQLGVSFSPRADTARGKQPVYEIDGVPLPLLDEFSRRGDIESRMAALTEEYIAIHGKNPSKKIQYAIAQRTTLETRKAKKPPQTLTGLRSEWAERAAAVLPYLDGESAVAHVALSQQKRPVFEPTSLPQLGREVADVLSRKQGTWTVWNINAEVQRRLREFRFASNDALATTARALTELVVADWCIEVFKVHKDAPMRLADRIIDNAQRLHIADPVSLTYTSQQVLNAEEYMRMRCEESDRHVVRQRVLDSAITAVESESGHCLGADQVALVTHFLTAGTHVAAGVGAAGTGKTTAMKVVARAWERSHGSVIALGPSARAAEVLGEEIGVEGHTIDYFLTKARHGIRTGINPGDLLLVDEAGMASARNLADLTKLAAREGAVVRLLGDPQQLPSVESSGILRDLAERTKAPMLSTVHRFSTDGEAAASLRLRAGDQDVLEWYATHDRIREGMKHQLPELVFDAYTADVAAGHLTLMIAPTNDLVTDLNARAAAFYRTNGVVTGPEVPLSDGLSGAAGDIVVTRRNTSKYKVRSAQGQRRGRVKNGDLWRVLQARPEGSLLVQNEASGGIADFPADYVSSDVQLGYAATVHRCQGMTVASAHVLADGSMTRQSLYVALTRGKRRNLVYAANDELPDFDTEHTPEAHPGARGLLARIIGRDGSQRTAIEELAAERTRANSLPSARELYLHAASVLYDDYTSKLVAEVAGERTLARYLADPGWDSLVRFVAHAETNNWDAPTLLSAHVPSSADAADCVQRMQTIAAELTRSRRDDRAARMNLPALSPQVREADPIVAAWAQEQLAHAEGHIARYLTTEKQNAAEWLTACGEPTSDAHAQRIWTEAVTDIAINRLSNGITGTDPYEGVSAVKREKIAAKIGAATATTTKPERSRGAILNDLRAAEDRWRQAGEASVRARAALSRATARHQHMLAELLDAARLDTSGGDGAHAARIAHARSVADTETTRLTAAAEQAARDYDAAVRELAELDDEAARAGIRRRGNTPAASRRARSGQHVDVEPDIRSSELDVELDVEHDRDHGPSVGD